MGPIKNKFIIVIVCTIILFSTPSSFAQDISDTPLMENIINSSGDSDIYQKAQNICDNNPTKYHVGIHTARISKIDREVGSYDVNFWVWIQSSELETDFTKTPPPFDFINSEKITFSKTQITPTFYSAFVEGTFFNDFDFSTYPFEIINLPVIIEPYDQNVCETFFELDTRKWTTFDYELNDVISGSRITNLNIFESIYDYGIVDYSRITSEIVLEKTHC